MKLLQVISLLMDYPTESIAASRVELLDVVAQSSLTGELKKSLSDFINDRCARPLLDWQSEYDGLFERGRAVSLLLFEHIHGESRDRGQAMVNLQKQYQAAGLDIAALELPDYIPLYLEFLSTQGDTNAQIGLEEIAHILAVLACRLDERATNYAVLFHGLLFLSQVQVDLTDIQQQIKSEERDDTPEALDKVWEEEAVSFTAESDADACGIAIKRPTQSQSKDHQEFINVESLLNFHAGARTQESV
ncbi:nitrate reductase molybdenum cofactor assembly chaperone [Cellvibrio sp.]|uniref:nitrate reductase molybdenum cofactor assembly chaperone n=1 Tax=Cellvibrio sp. TaxID=1965322 RepID=UPI0039647789